MKVSTSQSMNNATTPSSRPLRAGRILSVAAASVVAVGTSTFGADATWNVNSGAWDLGTNWVGGVAPGLNDGSLTSTDTATFGNKTTPTVTVDANRNIFGINFSATSSAYTLSGGSLLLTSGGLIQSSGAGTAHTDTISTAMFLQGDGGAYSFTGGSSTAGRTLSLTGAIAGVSTGSNVTTLNLNGTNTGGNALGAGGISDGSGGGTLAINKSGTGRWNLSGANTFTGGTTLNSGALGLNSTRAIGDGPLTINGGTLDNSTGGGISLRSSVATTGTITGGSTTINSLASTAGLSVGQFVYGTNIPGGAYITSIGANSITLTAGASNTAGQQVPNTALTFGATNAQTWAGDFTFAGSGQSLNLGNGPVSLGANAGASRTLTVSANGLTIGGAISDGTNGTTPTRALVKSGTGSLGLYGASTYSGGTTINAGTVVIGNAAALGAGSLTMNGGTITNASFGLTLQNNPAQFWNGNFSAVATFGNGWSMGSGTVTLGNNVTITTGNGTYGALVTAAGVVQDDSPSTPRSLTFLPGGANPGGFALSGANTYSGGTTLSGAVLRLNNVQALGTGPLTINGGAINQNTGGLAITGISSIALNGDVSFGATTGAINLGTAPVVLSGARRITVDNGGATLGGVVSGSGASLIYSGTNFNNSLTLSNAANTYDGGTHILGGGSGATLNAGGASALGTGLVRLSSSANSRLNVATSNLTIDALSSTIVTPSFAAGTGSANGTIPLVFTGGGGSGAAGTATVTGGIIQSVSISNYGRDYTSAPAISYAGQGSGTITAGYASSSVILGANTLTLAGTNASPATYAGVISGTGGKLTKQGDGVQTLTGVNTFTGATAVTDGTLRLALAGSINSSSGVTINGADAIFTYDSSVGLNKPVSFGASGGTFVYNENTVGYSGGSLLVGAGATLAGSGKINGTVNADTGTIAPGNSPGILSVGGNVSLIGGTLEIEVSKADELPVAGSDYDQLNVTGASSLVDLSGGNLALTVGSGLAEGDLFFIVSNANTSGGTGGQFISLNGLADAGLSGVGTFTVSGTQFAISYAADFAGGTFTGGNDVALQVVPEPASMALLGFGALGLLGRRRRA